MDIPLYDNQEYRFRDDDSSSQTGREHVASLLGLKRIPSAEGLRFDLSFFSGGIGVCDRHAITMPADLERWAAVVAHLSAGTPTELANDEAWSDEFRWLVCGESDFPTLDDAAAAFINAEREDFQSRCTPDMTVLFQACSNVNDWVALWGLDTRLNFLAFSQG